MSFSCWGQEAYLLHSPDEKIKAPKVFFSTATGPGPRELFWSPLASSHPNSCPCHSFPIPDHVAGCCTGRLDVYVRLQGTVIRSPCLMLLSFEGGDMGWEGSGLGDLPFRVPPACSVQSSLVTSLQPSLNRPWAWAVCSGWAPGWPGGSWKALFIPTLGARQLFSGMASR